MSTRDELAAQLAAEIGDGYDVIALPAEASENTWTNDITGHVYATVTGRMVVLDDGELLTPDEIRHYAAALLAAARKAEETRDA